ncbi:MAG: hypothetical protein ACSHYA_17270 [Opitutaceae bacterium]
MTDKANELTFQNDMIEQLVADGWLLGTPDGYNRELALYEEEVFGLNVFGHQAEMKKESSGHKEASSGHKEESSGSKEASSGHSEVLKEHIETLRSIAAPVASAQRASKDLVVSTILQLCQGRYLSLAELAELLGRDPHTLRKNFIRVMLGEQQLLAEHPNIKTHPKQRYITAEPKAEEHI